MSAQKTEITINVYDLLPPGRLSSVLWTIGSSLLHSGVVIDGREYAYGGHDRPNLTGVYWTRPRVEPPGATFRCSILHGFTFATKEEIDRVVHEASEEFQGTSYNLLTRNCNHFTAHLCRRLTGRPGPAWLNRAASIGLALPCVVPREWIETPDYDDQGGELLEEGEGGDDDDDGEYGTSERSIMLRNTSSDQPRVAGTTADDDGERSATHHGSGSGSSARSRVRRDTSSGATASLPADLVVNRSAISGSRASRRGSNGGRGSIESSDGRGSDSADERVVAEVPDSEWDSAEERRRGGSGKDKKSRSRLP